MFRLTSYVAVIGFLCSFFTSCAHHRDVRAAESGVHSVVIRVEDPDQGFTVAKSQADHFCETQKKNVVTIEETSEFVGGGKEEDYKTHKKLAKMAQVGGAMAGVLGGKKERPIGAGVGTVGIVADAALGAGYRYVLKFKCAP